MSQQKVAVIGLGRSGTTWISKVVDSSPFVFYLHEPDYVKAVECVPYVSDADDFEVWERYLKDYVVTLPTACSARSVLKRPLFPKAYLGSLSARCNFMLFRGRLRLDQLLYKANDRSPARRWPKAVDNAEVMLWKSVDLAGSIGTILRALPDQKVLHSIRHPCGFIDSVLRGEKKGYLESTIPASEDAGLFDFAMRTKVAQRLGLRTADWLKFSKVERLAYFWLCINEQAAEDAQGCKNYMEVYFDEFCLNPLEYAKRIFAFLGMEFTPQTQQFLSSSTSSKSNEYYSVSRQSDEVPQTWKRHLDRESIDTILRIANSMPHMAEVIARSG
jgi:hypothetical protein